MTTTVKGENMKPKLSAMPAVVMIKSTTIIQPPIMTRDPSPDGHPPLPPVPQVGQRSLTGEPQHGAGVAVVIGHLGAAARALRGAGPGPGPRLRPRLPHRQHNLLGVRWERDLQMYDL
jgi:hypothetical protein